MLLMGLDKKFWGAEPKIYIYYKAILESSSKQKRSKIKQNRKTNMFEEVRYINEFRLDKDEILYDDKHINK